MENRRCPGGENSQLWDSHTSPRDDRGGRKGVGMEGARTKGGPRGKRTIYKPREETAGPSGGKASQLDPTNFGCSIGRNYGAKWSERSGLYYRNSVSWGTKRNPHCSLQQVMFRMLLTRLVQLSHPKMG